jgi:hypothetical protein
LIGLSLKTERQKNIKIKSDHKEDESNSSFGFNYW